MVDGDLQLGCYGDGAVGHYHTRLRCAEWLAVLDGPESLCRALHGDMTDDASEELEACNWLNEHVPTPGATWGWHNGDFGLWPEGEEE